MTHVLDASALLAFLHGEPGAHRVESVLDGALVSTVNWSEVFQKSLSRQADVNGIREDFEEIGVMLEPFTSEQAEIAAQLWIRTRRYGLSLADCACLALALERNASVLTADRTWGQIDLDLSIETLR